MTPKVWHARFSLTIEEQVAGVCGQLQLSNFDFCSRKSSLYNMSFGLSTLFIVGFQLYEYHFNQILGKRKTVALFKADTFQKQKQLMEQLLACREHFLYLGRQFFATL